MADNKGVATMAATALDTAKSLPMSGETRGHAIKARRLAHGIKSLRAFAEASGVSREAITAAEDGSASAATYDRLEAWLDSFEAETGADAPPALEEPTWPQVDRRAPAVPTVIKVRNDLGEVVIEAAPGTDRAQLVADAEALLMALVRVNRLAAQEPETPQSDS